MTNRNQVFTNDEVDQFADHLQEMVKAATSVSYLNYQASVSPQRKIGVMRAFDFPRAGITSAVSFGVAHEEFSGFPDRIELIQAWDRQSTDYERMMVVVADSIMMRGRAPRPGVIYKDAVKIAELPDISDRMPHALILFPYLWENAFYKEIIGTKTVWFLQVVPIFDDEMKFIEEKGFETFEQLLISRGVFFHQLDRKSQMALV